MSVGPISIVKTRILTVMMMSTLLMSIGVMAPGWGSAEAGSGIYEFKLTYVIEDEGTVTYNEEGLLTQGMQCPGGWMESRTRYSTSFDSRHIVHVRINTLGEMIAVDETQDNMQIIREYTCPTGVEMVSLSDRCNYGYVWETDADEAELRPLAPGWHPNGGTGTQLAIGRTQSVDVPTDLRYRYFRVNHYVGPDEGPVPFTGRMEFYDEVAFGGEPQNIISWDYVGGRCMEDREGGSSPWGCCRYDPDVRDVTYRARPTSFSAPPIGSWAQELEVCNTDCDV